VPNYKKEIETYRCGDLFKFGNHKEIYILSQTGYGCGMMVGLYDSSNRIAITGERPIFFKKGLNEISQEEINNLVESAENTFGKIQCIGNISEFELIKKENINVN